MNPEEVLRAARAAAPGPPLAEVVRAYWREQLERIGEAHRAGADGATTAQALAGAIDALVLQIYAEAGPPASPHALVAVGGYGRQEMSPYSDVDLLFLFPKAKDKNAVFISGVLRPLWDAGFNEVGHSSRTLAEVVEMSRQELEARTGMMDGRLLAGDAGLFAQFQETLFSKLPRHTLAVLRQWHQDRSQTGASVQLLEPNLKESPGGLRDLQVLEWALMARVQGRRTEELRHELLDAQEQEALAQGREFLWRVRHQLHLGVGRRHDVLEHSLKPQLARHFGYEDRGKELAVEQFMQHYYLHARAVYSLVQRALEQLTTRRRQGRRLLLEEGVEVVDEKIEFVAGEAYFAVEPLRLLRIFSLLQTRRLRLSEQAQRAVRASLHLIDEEVRRAPEARDAFMAILRRRQCASRTLRAMHQLGVLGAYLPEFGALTCLVQYDIYHLYTVDEHVLVALDNLESRGRAGEGRPLDRLFAEFPRRDLLYLGVLLHDIGKSRREDHIVCGLEMAGQLLERIGLPREDRRFVLFLVAHHQDMVIISQRRDLDDYRMIAEFAGLFANLGWLEALYLVSYADLSAVARDAWTDWQGALLWDLYHKTREQIESGLKTLEEQHHVRQLLEMHLRFITGTWPAHEVAAFQAHVQQLPSRYLMAYNRDQIEAHLELIGRLGERGVELAFVERQGFTEVVICTRDQRQLLAKICAVLAVNDIDILRAQVNTRADAVVLDTFQVTDVDGAPVLPERKQQRVREQLAEVIGGSLGEDPLFGHYRANWNWRARKEGDHVRPPELRFDNQVSDKYTVVEVDAQDQVGLLYKITQVFGGQGLDIHTALINTVADRATDAFYVVDGKGRKIVNYEVLEGIRQQLLERLAL
ncbi:MAG: [protein-PII] uridylyltransferase [Candidatus Handelsmanbacteria bacterium]|nr:[protein-PII] uridylyltransferase [Candidatus Handelsmanbacteria bacterium]